jgi:hypothetical protein
VSVQGSSSHRSSAARPSVPPFATSFSRCAPHSTLTGARQRGNLTMMATLGTTLSSAVRASASGGSSAWTYADGSSSERRIDARVHRRPERALPAATSCIGGPCAGDGGLAHWQPERGRSRLHPPALRWPDCGWRRLHSSAPRARAIAARPHTDWGFGGGSPSKGGGGYVRVIGGRHALRVRTSVMGLAAGRASPASGGGSSTCGSGFIHRWHRAPATAASMPPIASCHWESAIDGPSPLA